MIDFARWDVAALGAAWRAARPFPHLAIDGLLDGGDVQALREAMAKEPHWPGRGELFDFMASTDALAQPALRGFREALGGAAGRAAVAAITGRPVERIEVRSYVYLAGHYLLPHADWRAGAGRTVAFAYYLTPAGGCEGGELELFECAVEDGQVARARAAGTVAHRENRLVLFDVGVGTVHQVREVLRGARLSLAGWFLDGSGA